MKRPTKLEILRGDVIDFVRNCHVGYGKVYSEPRKYGYRMKFYDIFDSRLPLKSVQQYFKEYFPNLKVKIKNAEFLSKGNWNYKNKEAVCIYVYIPNEVYEEV